MAQNYSATVSEWTVKRPFPLLAPTQYQSSPRLLR